jgi:transposase InsO family protein
VPWQEAETMSLRREFVEKAIQEGANMSALCRAYNISRPTGYTWRDRYLAEGEAGLRDRSRRPHNSPNRTLPEVERKVLAARRAHPAWGGRKLKRYLENQGHDDIPQPSTVTEILRRHDRIDPAESAKRTAHQRFERARPNELWQMDFKGHFPLETGARCYPLTVLDDHSRYLVGLQACADEGHQTVKERLTGIFRTYGLPQCILIDNGPPWSDGARQQPWTKLSVWWLRLGIAVTRSSIRHPQTLGKDERLHRSLDDELLNACSLADFETCQQAFDRFRQMYNTERPHEAHALDTPAEHYQSSLRPFPDPLPPLVFPAGAAVRKVSKRGCISYHNHTCRVGKPFDGQAVGVLPDDQDDGVIHIFFNDMLIRTLDLRQT